MGVLDFAVAMTAGLLVAGVLIMAAVDLRKKQQRIEAEIEQTKTYYDQESARLKTESDRAAMLIRAVSKDSVPGAVEMLVRFDGNEFLRNSERLRKDAWLVAEKAGISRAQVAAALASSCRVEAQTFGLLAHLSPDEFAGEVPDVDALTSLAVLRLGSLTPPG